MEEKSHLHPETFVRINRAIRSPGSPFQLEVREDRIWVTVWISERESTQEPNIDITEHHVNIEFEERRLIVNMLRPIRPDSLEVERSPDRLVLYLEPFDAQIHPTLIFDAAHDEDEPYVETPRARVSG